MSTKKTPEEQEVYSLSEYRMRKSLHLADKLDIAISLCKKLKDLVKQDPLRQIIHSDEIKVNVSGEIVGIIPSLEHKETSSRFISPEVRDGAPMSERNMVWSCGVLLYEFFTDTVFQGLMQRDMPTSEITTVESGLPDPLLLLLYRMLEQDGDLRIAGLDQVYEELYNISVGLCTDSGTKSATDTQLISSTTHSRTSEDFSTFGMRFIGRNHEMSELRSMLTTASTQLITLVGLGGIGKSRLAYEVGQELSGNFRDGVYFISLNPVRSPAFIVLAIGNAMGFAFRGRKEERTQLIRHLSNKNMLLILDDFDELTQGSEIILDILEDAPGIRIIVTSRQRLNVRSERVYELVGLPVPVQSEMDPVSFSSIQLFNEHARRVHPEFDLDKELPAVIRICNSLAGMPLGIELAAGWTRVLSCAEIADEIDHDIDFLATKETDLPQRHRGIRATFDRSWRSLEKHEKLGLAQLSVFRNGFHREAAGEIASVDLAMLARFIDKSLIRRDAFGRYSMHQLVRQYAEYRLSEFPDCEELLHERHARFFGTYLEELTKHFWGGNRSEILSKIEVEFPDIRIAWDYAISNGYDKMISQWVNPLMIFLESRGWFHEACSFWDDAEKRLRPYGEDESNRSGKTLYGTVLSVLGHSYGSLGAYSKSREILEKARDILEIHGTTDSLANVYTWLGDVYSREGKYDLARTNLECGLKKSIKAGNRSGEANILDALGTIFMYTGDYNLAREHHEQSLQIWRKLGDDRGLAISLNNLGNAFYCEGKHEKAKSQYEEAAGINRRIGRKQGLRTSLGNVGNILNVGGQFEEARELYEECLAIAMDLEDKHAIAHSKYQLSVALENLNDLDTAEEMATHSLALHRNSGEKRGQALVLISLGRIYKRKNQLDKSVDYFKQSETLFREIGAKWGIVFSLTNLTAVFLAREDIPQAEETICEALRLASLIKSDSLTLAALSHAARLLELRNLSSEAYSMYSFIINHRASEFESENNAKDGIRRLKMPMPSSGKTVSPSSPDQSDCSYYVNQASEILKR